MPKIFQKTIQHLNILIEDKAGKFILTNPIPYEGAQFPNQGLIRYLKSKNIPIKEKYKLLRYHQKVSKEAQSLEMLATFWVQTDKDSKELSSILQEDENKNGVNLIEEYSKLIENKIMAGYKVFAWQGDTVVDNPR